MQRFCPEIGRGDRYGDRLAARADLSDIIHRSVHTLHREWRGNLPEKQAELAALAAENRAQEDPKTVASIGQSVVVIKASTVARF